MARVAHSDVLGLVVLLFFEAIASVDEPLFISFFLSSGLAVLEAGALLELLKKFVKLLLRTPHLRIFYVSNLLNNVLYFLFRIAGINILQMIYPDFICEKLID